MYRKNAEYEVVNYITLETENTQETGKKTETEIFQEVSSENEWQQEYRLIYGSQRLEGWSV